MVTYVKVKDVESDSWVWELPDDKRDQVMNELIKILGNPLKCIGS